MTSDDRELLAAEYVLGTLGPGAVRDVVERLEHDEDLSGRVAAWQQRLQNLEPANETINPPAALWDRIDNAVTSQQRSAAPAAVTIRAGEGAWQTISPGVKRKLLFADREAGTESFLLRFAKGAEFPAHDHTMFEECFVLEGSVRIGSEVITAGDYHLMAPGVPHAVAVSDTGALMFMRGERRAAT